MARKEINIKMVIEIDEDDTFDEEMEEGERDEIIREELSQFVDGDFVELLCDNNNIFAKTIGQSEILIK